MRVSGSQPTICPFELALHTVEFLRKVKFVKLEVFTLNQRQQQHIVAIKKQLIRAIVGIISGLRSFRGGGGGGGGVYRLHHKHKRVNLTGNLVKICKHA